MAVGSIVVGKPKKWQVALKALIPVALALVGAAAGTLIGTLVSHEASINSHAGRIAALERSQEQQRVVHERILDTLTQIQVALGRLEERIAALQRPR